MKLPKRLVIPDLVEQVIIIGFAVWYCGEEQESNDNDSAILKFPKDN
jgi:hypothetical protein